MEAITVVDEWKLEKEQHRLEGMACALMSAAERQSFDMDNDGWMLMFFGEELERSARTIEQYVEELFRVRVKEAKKESLAQERNGA